MTYCEENIIYERSLFRCMEIHRLFSSVHVNKDMETGSDFALYTCFRSSCSGRLRIALNLKGISYSPKYVNLGKNEQASSEYDEIESSHSVSSLLGVSVGLTNMQSVAALAYLEEKYPDSAPLIPPAPNLVVRAYVRNLVNIISCDTHPVTNMRILNRVCELGGSKEDWAKDLMTEGLVAYDRLAGKTAGKYSGGRGNDGGRLPRACGMGRSEMGR